MDPVSLAAILDSLKRHMDQWTDSEVDWLTKLLNLTWRMPDEEFDQVVQTLLTVRDERKCFNRIIEKGGF